MLLERFLREFEAVCADREYTDFQRLPFNETIELV